MTENKVNKDKNKLRDAVKTSDGKGQKIDTGETVYFTNFKRVHVAQGFMDDTMYVTVPLWYDRPIMDKKTGDLLYTKKELENFAVLSSHEIIRPSDSYFREKNIIAEFPETVLDERWSMNSIKAFRDLTVTVDPGAVFSKLKETWKHYMDLSGNPGTYTALPLVNTLSYCLFLFQYAPYLKYEGEKGSSKSKACEMHEYIDFNAFSGVDYTPAVIFRTLQDTRGTLIIDEAETYNKIGEKSEYEQAREAILNSGFKANGKVSRMEKTENHFKRVDYHVFGIKIIGSIHGVSETIRDRSYQIMLTKTLNREISKRTLKPNDPAFQEIRDMLYVMTLTHWKEIRDIEQNEEMENRLGLIGREWDKAKPLLVLATFYARHDPDHGNEIIDDLWEFLKDQKNREIALTIDTFDEVVIEKVEQAIRDEAKTLNLAEIDDRDFIIRLPEVSLAIATLEGKAESRNFSLRSYSRSIRSKIQKLAIGRDFRHSTHNMTVFTSNLKLIEIARKRYGISPSVEEKTDVINSFNLFNLINLINSFNSVLRLKKVNQKNDPIYFDSPSLTPENIGSLEAEVKELIKLIKKRTASNTLKMEENTENFEVQNKKKEIHEENGLKQDSSAEPLDSNIRGEKVPKCCIGYPGKFALDRDLMLFLAGYVRSEAPKREYHRMTADEVLHELKVCDPTLTMGTVVRLLEDAYNKHGYLVKTHNSYGVNPEVPLGEGSKEGDP